MRAQRSKRVVVHVGIGVTVWLLYIGALSIGVGGGFTDSPIIVGAAYGAYLATRQKSRAAMVFVAILFTVVSPLLGYCVDVARTEGWARYWLTCGCAGALFGLAAGLLDSQGRQRAGDRGGSEKRGAEY